MFDSSEIVNDRLSICEAVEAFSWVTLSRALTASFIWTIPSVCSLLAVDTLSITSLVSIIIAFKSLYPSIISFAIDFPSFDLADASSTKSFISLAASALLEARFLTSWATTANPLPASPAVAASTAALSERIFVWNAIWSITLIASLIAVTLLLISSIEVEVLVASSFPTSADAYNLSESDVIFTTFELVLWIFEVISSTAAAVSSSEAACSLEAVDKVFEEDIKIFVSGFNSSPAALIIAISPESELPSNVEDV